MATVSITYAKSGSDVLTGVEYASYTYRNGIQPSTAVILCSKQSPGATIGDLTIAYTKEASDGTNAPASGSATIPDCIVVAVEAASGSPDMLQVTLLDRRWRWANGHLDGLYNVRNPDETYDYEKTVAELMTLCLDAMGETGYTLTAVTASSRNAMRPTVDWVAVNPALALDTLCLETGFDVTFDSSANVTLVDKGSGTAPLTTAASGTEQNEFTISSSVAKPVPPEYIRTATGAIQFECVLKMKPGGIDNDLEIKALGDLSYGPDTNATDNGFEPGDVRAGFDRVTGETTVNGITYKHQDLAKKSIGRVWMIDEMAHTSDNFAPPGFNDSLLGLSAGTTELDPADVTSIDQILPVVPFLNSETTLPGGGKARDRYKVEGVFLEEDNEEGENTAGLWEFGSSLDPSTGNLTLGEPALKYNANADEPVEWAAIYLRCVVTVDHETNQKIYYAKTGSQIAGGSGVRTLRHPEIELRTQVDWSEGANALEPFATLGQVTDNRTEVDAECDYYIDAETDRLDVSTGFTVGYEGIRYIAPNSLMRAITYSAGSSILPRTVAYYGTEPLEDVVGYDEQQEINARMLDQAEVDAAIKVEKKDAKKRHASERYVGQ